MPASHPRHIMASIRTERRDSRSHRSPSSIDHHLLLLLSHLWTSSEAWRRSSSPQGTLQLRQIVSGTPPWLYMETSSRSSTWQVDRPAPKRQQPPTCRSVEAGYQAWSRWKSDATVQRLRDYLTWPDLNAIGVAWAYGEVLIVLLHLIPLFGDWRLTHEDENVPSE